MTGYTVLFLVLAVALLLTFELIAIFGLQRVSRIHQRITGEAYQALQTRPAAPGEPKTVLFVGNSLLLQGVNLPRLVENEAPRFRVSRFVVDNTNWYDWYYGLKALFHDGARPDYLVLCLSDPNYVSNSFRGDFTARFLFDLRDLWPLSRDLHMDMTSTSNLYAAHFSTFYGARSELRQVLMGKAIPAVPTLMQQLTVTPAPHMKDEEVMRIAVPRFRQLKELCAQYRVRCVVMMIPVLGNYGTALDHAASSAQIPFYRPIPNGKLDRSLYSDGFHLGEQGADLYTAAIEADMGTWE